MKPNPEMTRLINGRRYTVSTAKLIASNDYWDGTSQERDGRNTFLYKARSGAFFLVHLTQWENERDSIQPVTQEEAINLYNQSLPEHKVEYSEAFETEPEDIRGRQPLYGDTMKQTAIYLAKEQIAYLKTKPGTASDYIRRLLEEDMKK